MFNKILLPVDGSDHSKKAIEYVKSLAEKYHSKVVIINVVELPILIDPYQIHGNIYDDLERSLKEQAKSILENTKNELSGLEVETKALEGNAELIITNMANENDFDLIVMSNRGLTAFKGFLLGSVSNYVVHHAKCPVFMIK